MAPASSKELLDIKANYRVWILSETRTWHVNNIQSKILMLNFSAEIFFWRILQLWFNENVWNYYIDQKECVGVAVNPKKLIHMKYWILPFLLYSVSILVLNTMNPLSILISGINNNNLFLFCLTLYFAMP